MELYFPESSRHMRENKARMVRQVTPYSVTDIGVARNANEDSFLSDPTHNVYIVADGMGGHADGKLASDLACRVLHEYMLQNIVHTAKKLEPAEIMYGIRLGFDHVNGCVSVRNNERFGRNAMGTTLSSVMIIEGIIYYANVGDTRIYYVPADAEKIITLSEDHTLAERLISKGATPEFVNPDYKHTLTQAIGTHGVIAPNVGMLPELTTDYILLCTDGLYNYFTEQELLDIMLHGRSSGDEVLSSFVEKAIISGGEDNITCIMLQFD